MNKFAVLLTSLTMTVMPYFIINSGLAAPLLADVHSPDTETITTSSAADPTQFIPLEDITNTRITVFSAKTLAKPSYRIPSIVTTSSGSILLFSEERDGWKDKSKTNIVMKRSTDNGQTWSSQIQITHQTGTQAYMDPTSVLDQNTGEIFLFTSRWNSPSADARTVRSFLSTSTDDGITWTNPVDITAKVGATSPASVVRSFGPGSGLQLRDGENNGRLILATSLIEKDTKRTVMRSLYSDDHGVTWQLGEEGSTAGEQQIAEVSEGKLIRNIRAAGKRHVSHSTDDGLTWSKITTDPELVVPAKGCHASVLGKDKMAFFASPYGGPRASGFDDRYDLVLWRSPDDGLSWPQQVTLFKKAAGYTGMTKLLDGSFAIAFESARTQGFTTSSTRHEGWMNIDVLIVPASLWNSDYWIH